MTYHERIIKAPKMPKEVVEAVSSLEAVRAAVLRLETVLHYGAISEGALTQEEMKVLDKAVTVIKVGMKIAKRSLSHRDPKRHLIEKGPSDKLLHILGGHSL